MSRIMTRDNLNLKSKLKSKVRPSMNKDDTAGLQSWYNYPVTNDTCQLKKANKDGKHYTIQIK